MDTEIYIVKKSEVVDKISELFENKYKLYVDIQDILNNFISTVAGDCYFVLEFPYVDKVYRDSYYNYYSSKLGRYRRNCIKVCIFDKEIEESDFRKKAKLEYLNESFSGFFVIRPTLPNPIGRSVISPKIVTNDGFITCTSKYNTTCNSIKLNVRGFPYSSQDTETISCAETTLWAIMEYFSNKYSDYAPLLPSKIVESLSGISEERQLPSKGLNIFQISYALKDFGFGPRIYSRNAFQNFESLFSTYIESGIPLVVEMDDDGEIYHALVCSGREKFNNDMIDTIPENDGIFDIDYAPKRFVFIDDNHPPYQFAKLNEPAANYHSSWKDCSINQFIAPLYTKIYLEAFKAKKFTYKFIKDNGLNNDIYLRLFLTSSRSFKHFLAIDSTMTTPIKNFVLGTPMPKFLWVAELFSKEGLSNREPKGLILLDATAANIQNKEPLLVAFYNKSLFVKLGFVVQEFTTNREIEPFNLYIYNLNGF